MSNLGYGNAPIDYGRQMVADYFQMQPASVKGRYNAAVETEKRYLYTKLASVFEFTIPKTWPLELFRLFLFYYGSTAVVYTNQYGWIFWTYGVTKVGLYYLPSEVEVWNGHLKNAARGVLGLNAEIIRVMDDWRGLDDLVTKYAVQLSQIDKSLQINLMNANVSLYAEAGNKKDADDIYSAYGQATEGKPMVVINKELLKGGQLKTLIQNPKSQFVALELLQARQDVLNMFLTDIGIPTANYNKRAQMSPDEIGQRNGERMAVISIIKDTVQSCFDRLNAISGLGCRIDFRKEVIDNGTVDSMGDATVRSDNP